jgi:hypothetical protein
MANSTRPGKEAKSAQRNLQNQGRNPSQRQDERVEQIGRGVRPDQSPQERQRVQRDLHGGENKNRQGGD